MTSTYDAAPMMAFSPIWQDPPPEPPELPQGGKYRFLLAALRSNPGKWALVREYQTPGAAKQSARGFTLSDPWDGCEVVSSGRCVYARFVGESS